MSVTVVSCVYGKTFARFIPRWIEYIRALDPAPDAVILAADHDHSIPGAYVAESACNWKHPQAYYLQRAISHAETDWVWIVDIDDCAKPDGLRGLDDVSGDVWQMGFLRSDGELYIPEPVSNDDYLASWRNTFVGASAIRTSAFRECGGFSDVALQDWALWRRLARDGATFEFSDRPHYTYMRHQYTRGQTELTMDRRADDIAEMVESEQLALA